MDIALGIDIGTSRVKVACISDKGELIASTSVYHTFRYTRNVLDILEAMKEAINVLRARGVKIDRIRVISISGQAPTVIPSTLV